MSEAKRYTGTVKWFNPQKGFGFITPDNNDTTTTNYNGNDGPQEDLFVHHTSIRSTGFRTLYEAQPVEFSIDFSEEDMRSKAVDVSVLNRSQGSGRGRGWYGGRGGGGGGRRGGYGGYGGGVGAGGGGGRGVECYNCGRMGHLARECYQGEGGGLGGGASGRDRGGRRYGGGGDGGGGGGGYGRGGGGGGYGRGGGGGGRRKCFNCGEEGHLARDCPNVE